MRWRVLAGISLLAAVAPAPAVDEPPAPENWPTNPAVAGGTWDGIAANGLMNEPSLRWNVPVKSAVSAAPPDWPVSRPIFRSLTAAPYDAEPDSCRSSDGSRSVSSPCVIAKTRPDAATDTFRYCAFAGRSAQST